MQFLNPKTDFAFKRIFGSDQSHDILLSFLNALLSLEGPYRLEEVDILDPYMYMAPQILGMKETYVDVKARDGQGCWYIIEMQVLNVEGFEKRVLYNACKAYAGQLEGGQRYHLLTDVIAITITDFTMFPEREGVVSAFKLRADDGGLYGEDLQLVFAELPKFQKGEAELVTVLDKWCYFLRHAPDLRMIPPILDGEPAIAHALRIADRAGLSPEELDTQEKREMFIQDQLGSISRALAEGEAKGRAEGEAKGKQQERLRIAQDLLPRMDDEAIAALTQLTIAQVQALRKH